MADLVLGDEAGRPERTISLPQGERKESTREEELEETLAVPVAVPLEESSQMNQMPLSPSVLFEQVTRRVAGDPSLVQRVNAVYQFHVLGEDGGAWVVDLKNGAGDVWAGQHDAADCIISMSRDDFLALATGQINPLNAFMQGRIRVQGDIMMATRLQSLF
jgi:alkyl sulfatase BDS1-like metallo-beta-lactamase superfamily hydrolase